MSRWILLAAVVALLSSCAQNESTSDAVADAPTTTAATATTSTPSVTAPSPTTTMEATTTTDSAGFQIAAAVYEEWIAAWEAHDPQRIAAVFTPEGVYINPLGEVVVGREAMEAYVMSGHVVRNGELGAIEQIEPGVFRAPFVFEAKGPTGWATGSGDLELELEGELAARVEFVTFDGFRST
jgi:hypothetical protein